MATYKYKAKKDPQNTVEGTLEASSENEAIDKINQLGLVPVIVQIQEASGQTKLRETAFTGRVRGRDITVLSRQLASLLRSGVPILRALSIMLEQTQSRGLQEVLRTIHACVKEGSTFSLALSRFPKAFPPLYIALIRTGEDSGGLPDALVRIAEYRKKQEEMASRMRLAMAYPLLMGIVGCATVVFMLTFVMPRLMTMYVSMQQALPLPTRIVLSVSQGLRTYWVWIAVSLAALLFFFTQQSRSKAGKFTASIFKLKMPLFGKYLLKAELARFCRTLELLIKSGIPILKALEISIPVLDNELIKQQLSRSHKELEQGGSFGKSLKAAVFFPLFMTNLIAIGEESGKLNDALGEVANSYERETDETLQVLSSLLEPLMILVMGSIVGFLVIAMLLPIFEINIMVR